VLLRGWGGGVGSVLKPKEVLKASTPVTGCPPVFHATSLKCAIQLRSAFDIDLLVDNLGKTCITWDAGTQVVTCLAAALPPLPESPFTRCLSYFPVPSCLPERVALVFW
jgi:hypothetical protein